MLQAGSIRTATGGAVSKRNPRLAGAKNQRREERWLLLFHQPLCRSPFPPQHYGLRVVGCSGFEGSIILNRNSFCTGLACNSCGTNGGDGHGTAIRTLDGPFAQPVKMATKLDVSSPQGFEFLG